MIPNHLYNRRRQALISVIRLHLKDHPRDERAAKQLNALMTAPDIQPLALGNSAVMDWAEE